jgi:TetR/AcrR family transcriptional regulator, cholesterol catabolism regulator
VTEPSSPARERLIEAAEVLFAEKGYAAVRLRDIAEKVKLHHATLYHHVPGGKEELYIEVTERGLNRHRIGLENAIAAAGDELDAKLLAAAHWLASQPPLDLARMTHADMPELSEGKAEHIMQMAYEALMLPLTEIFEKANVRWGDEQPEPDGLAGAFLSMLEGVHIAPIEKEEGLTKGRIADMMVKIFLYGIKPR